MVSSSLAGSFAIPIIQKKQHHYKKLQYMYLIYIFMYIYMNLLVVLYNITPYCKFYEFL